MLTQDGAIVGHTLSELFFCSRSNVHLLINLTRYSDRCKFGNLFFLNLIHRAFSYRGEFLLNNVGIDATHNLVIRRNICIRKIDLKIFVAIVLTARGVSTVPEAVTAEKGLELKKWCKEMRIETKKVYEWNKKKEEWSLEKKNICEVRKRRWRMCTGEIRRAKRNA